MRRQGAIGHGAYFDLQARDTIGADVFKLTCRCASGELDAGRGEHWSRRCRFGNAGRVQLDSRYALSTQCSLAVIESFRIKYYHVYCEMWDECISISRPRRIFFGVLISSKYGTYICQIHVQKKLSSSNIIHGT